jgi:hypothetical protein
MGSSQGAGIKRRLSELANPLPTPNTPAIASARSGLLNPLARISSLLFNLILPRESNIVLREVSCPRESLVPEKNHFVTCHLPPITSEEEGQYSHWSASPQSETAQEKGTQQRKQAESVRVMPALAEADTRITSESLPECRQAHLRRT